MLLERTRNLGLAFVVVLSLAAVAGAETVRLKDGRMIAGEVRVEGRTVVVDATFPKVATFTLRRDEIAPESLRPGVDGALRDRVGVRRRVDRLVVR